MTESQTEFQRESTEQIADYVQDANAEQLRSALAVPDTAANWRQLLLELHKRPNVPDASPIKNRVAAFGLQKMFIDVEQKRSDAAMAMLSSLTVARSGRPLGIYRSLVFRYLARYLDAKQTYEKLWQGKPPAENLLPEYLTPYVRSKESGHLLIRATEVILPMQYDVQEKAGLQESPRELAPIANEILLGAVNRRVSLRYVLACLQGNVLAQTQEPYRAFLGIAGFEVPQDRDLTQQEQEATKLVVGYIAKYLDAIRTSAGVENTKMEDMTVADALEASLGAHPLAELTKEIMNNVREINLWSVPDLRETAKKVLENKSLYPERLVQAALAPLSNVADASASDRDEFRINAAEVSKFLMSFDADRLLVKHVDGHTQHMNDKQRAMVIALCDEVKSDRTVNLVLRSLFVHQKPTDALDTEANEQIRQIIGGGEMTLHEAFTLYYLSHTKSGAGLPLTYAGIGMLENHGQSTLSFDLQARALRSLANLTLSSSTSLPSKLENLGFDEAQTTEMRNGVLALKDMGFEHGANALLRTWSLLKNHWDILIAAGIVPAGIAGWKALRFVEARKFRLFAYGGTEEVRQTFKLAQSVTNDQILVLQKEMQSILSERSLLWSYNIPEKWQLTGQARGVMRATRSDIEDMATVLHKRYGNAKDIAQKMREANATDDDIWEALHKRGYEPAGIQKAIDGIGKTPKQMDDQTKAAIRAVEAKTANQLSEFKGLLNTQKESSLREFADQLRSRLVTADTLKGTAQIAELRKLSPDVQRFQRELNTYCAAAKNEGLRREIVTRLLGDIDEAKMTAILTAHTTEKLVTKFHTMKSAGLPDDQTRILMRLGIAGESPALAEPAAESMLRGAASADEVSRALRNIDRAGELMESGKILLGAAGAGLDVFGMSMAVADWEANEHQILQTDNPELKRLYESARPLIAAEGGTSAVGLVMGGISIVSTSAGFVMLPVGMSVLATRYSYETLRQKVELWSMTDDDWNRKDPEELLASIRDNVPSYIATSDLYKAFVNESEAGANQHSRVQAYEAYFRNSVPDTLSTPDDSRRFINHCLIYIKKTTNNAYSLVSASELGNAVAYAEMMEKRTAGDASVSTILPNGDMAAVDIGNVETMSPDDMQAIVLRYQREILDPFTFEQLCREVMDHPEAAVSGLIATRLRHQIAVLGAKAERISTDAWVLVQNLIRVRVGELMTYVSQGIKALQAGDRKEFAKTQSKYDKAASLISDMADGDVEKLYSARKEGAQTKGARRKS